MTAKAMTAKKAPNWQLRARRVQADLRAMAERKAASYSPAARRRYYPFVLGPVSRYALRLLQDEMLPLPPDGKTKLQGERLARMKIIRERIERLPPVHLNMKLTPNRLKLLNSLSSGVKLYVQFAGQSNDVEKLLSERLIAKVDHPTVKDRSGYPADGLQITASGRALLAASNKETKAPRPTRRTVVSSEPYAVRQQLARLSCGHQVIIRARGAKMKYSKTAICPVCDLRELSSALGRAREAAQELIQARGAKRD